MGDYHKVIGIDLGTTFSVVSTFAFNKGNHGEVIVIPSPQNQRTTPSVIYIAKNGQISVGDGARRRLERDPGGVIFEAKRHMGERDESGGKYKIPAAGMEFEPEFVSAAILKELKGYAERFIGEPIHDAVITVPAYFKEPQKKATEDAARMARLNPRLLVNEPTAAAVAYGLNEEEDLTYIVYDFGGGTFDVSVVRVRNGKQFDILGTGGDSKLGGGDIDEILIKWMLANMKAEHGRDFSQDAKLVGKIRLEAERVKIALCNSDTEQEFELDQPTPDIERVSYFIGPAEFRKRIRPLLERTVHEVDVAMKSAAKKASIGWDDIDAFVMVGGSSKIPYVRQMLAEKYGKPIKADLNPDEIVSIGAARLALDYQPSQFHEPDEEKALTIDETATAPTMVDTQIKDVVSHTLGIGLKDDRYDPLIEKDKYIPHRVHRKGYTTAEDNQRSIYIPVFQGDNPKASLNYNIGDVVIDDLAPAPIGTHHFEVIFALDANGIFYGQVVHTETGVAKDIKLQRGEAELVEKRRMELADLLDQGSVSGMTEAKPDAASASPDPVSVLIERAQAALNTLPAGAQGEMNAALAQLVLAQHGKNAQAQGQAVLRIRSLLDAYQTA